MNLLRLVSPLVALTFVLPAAAQTAAPTPKSAPPAASDVAAMHERCKAVMGHRMDPKQPHDHMRDKQGMMTWPNGKAPTAAEMQRMHEQCAAMMAKAGPPPAKK